MSCTSLLFSYCLKVWIYWWMSLLDILEGKFRPVWFSFRRS